MTARYEAQHSICGTQTKRNGRKITLHYRVIDNENPTALVPCYFRTAEGAKEYAETLNKDAQ